MTLTLTSQSIDGRCLAKRLIVLLTVRQKFAPVHALIVSGVSAVLRASVTGFKKLDSLLHHRVVRGITSLEPVGKFVIVRHFFVDGWQRVCMAHVLIDKGRETVWKISFALAQPKALSNLDSGKVMNRDESIVQMCDRVVPIWRVVVSPTGEMACA